ncbi:MAG: PDZ domain-containing protein [Actinomycetota bacterium]|nr:PDZ domain-containing protein [Actinomycetota bacterium]
MSTIDQMVQDHPGREEPRRKRSGHLWITVVTLVLLIALAAGYIWADKATSKLYAIAPGEARSVQAYINVPQDKVHTHRGQIMLVTVALLTVKPLSWIRDKLNSDIQLVDTKALTGNSPASQLNQVNQVEMQTSTQTAVIVALRRLGYKVDLTGKGAEVTQVVAKSPADGHLAPGDVIVAIDGTPTLTNQALVAAIRSHHPGDQVKLAVENSAGKQRTETVTLGQSPPDPKLPDAPHAFLGIATATKQQTSLPIDVSIAPGNIGGPSAGLAFTLGVIDDLSTGDLTGGRNIAVTGTINPDGTVGEVGGVVQKTVAVRNAGATAFLVPPGEYNDAVKHAGSKLKVIKVTTLEDALAALRNLGGDLSAVGPPPTVPATH